MTHENPGIFQEVSRAFQGPQVRFQMTPRHFKEYQGFKGSQRVPEDLLSGSRGPRGFQENSKGSKGHFCGSQSVSGV